ncbi:hypothetical protein [Butyrivibrio sp. AE2005]|uniref:hypothetical protein n=1 Tax=Butyrivibrio sp. AE2005 TaxID=1496722 RepID=UPI00047B1D30|nr:hypothetical protein [Butyrivibrio sp. AE2005]
MSDLFEGFKGINVIEEKRIGRKIGEDIQLIKWMCKKITKGKDVYTIASELEADDEIDKIKKIVDVVMKHTDDYDAEKIYDELSKNNVFDI